MLYIYFCMWEFGFIFWVFTKLAKDKIIMLRICVDEFIGGSERIKDFRFGVPYFFDNFWMN